MFVLICSKRTTVFVLFGLCLVQVVPIRANTCHGCLELDGLTFDKVLSKFPTVLVKFDVAYPYGDKHEAFAKIAGEAAEHADFAVGVVGIKDYGEKDNSQLAERFKVGDTYPAIKLFRNGNADKWVDFGMVWRDPFMAREL